MPWKIFQYSNIQAQSTRDKTQAYGVPVYYSKISNTQGYI